MTKRYTNSLSSSLCACAGGRNDGNEFSGSVFQKVSEKVEVGAQLSWSGANSMRFGIAAKYCAHPDTTFRVGESRELVWTGLAVAVHSGNIGDGSE